MELGWSYPKRKKLLEELSVTLSGKTYPLAFQNTLQHFSIYSVPISLPKYRLGNGRTYAAQAEYLAGHPDISQDFFSADPELDEAIKIQHTLLKPMISEKGLSEYFKKNIQQQPLILTHQGFVLNGNRRLCAMREFLETDEEKYTRFQHVDIIILPPADEKDLDELEAQLQIHQDIKAGYKWTTFALMLRKRQQEHGYTADRLAQVYERKSSEITEYIDMLSYAEDYLKERSRQGQYHTVDQDEFAFRQLRKKRKELTGEQDKEIFEKVSYALIDGGEGGRPYGLISSAADCYNQILGEIVEEFEIDDAQEDVDEDILGGKNKTSTKNIDRIINLFDDKKNRENIREIVINVIKAEEAKEKEKKRTSFVLNQLKKANSHLTDAANALKADTPKKGMKEQIESIEDSITKVKKWLYG